MTFGCEQDGGRTHERLSNWRTSGWRVMRCGRRARAAAGILRPPIRTEPRT